MSNIKKYLETYCEEAEIGMGETLEVKGASGFNMIPVQVIIDAIATAAAAEQKAIKANIARLDFRGANMRLYFAQLAQAIAI